MARYVVAKMKVSVLLTETYFLLLIFAWVSAFVQRQITAYA